MNNLSGPSVENALVHDGELWWRPNPPLQPGQIIIIILKVNHPA